MKVLVLHGMVFAALRRRKFLRVFSRCFKCLCTEILPHPQFACTEIFAPLFAPPPAVNNDRFPIRIVQNSTMKPERQSQKIHRILPRSMEVSTATISACTAKLLILRQLQRTSVVSEAVALLGMMNCLQWRITQMWAMSYT